jgi:hypothetical protein
MKRRMSEAVPQHSAHKSVIDPAEQAEATGRPGIPSRQGTAVSLGSVNYWLRIGTWSPERAL